MSALIEQEEIATTDTEIDATILEDNDEYFEPQLDDMILKSNSLNERLISLRAMSERLKQQIKDEKVKWMEELKQTAVLDKKFKEAHVKGADSYHDNYQIFRDYLFFAETSRTIDEAMRKKHYEQWLNEIEHDCNDELEKITKSITRLKPLKDIALKWDSEKGSGDHAVEKQHRSKPIESDDELEVTSSKITITNMSISADADNQSEGSSVEDGSTDGDMTVMNMPLE